MFDVWKSHVATNDDLPQIPVFLDLLAGPNYPLSQSVSVGRLESCATH